VAQFKYLGTTVAYQNLIQENKKRRVNSGNAFYHSAQDLRINMNIIFPMVPHVFENLSLTLREYHRPRMCLYENSVLRRIFGPNINEVTRSFRKLQNERHDLYSSSRITKIMRSRTMRWAGHEARIEKKGTSHRILFGKQV
jgi:hypothetical protein